MNATDVIACRPLAGFRLWLRFQDGTEGEVNLSHLSGKGVFSAWNERAFFEKAHVDSDAGTVAWPGGIDLDPYVLYSKVTGAALPGTPVSKRAAG